LYKLVAMEKFPLHLSKFEIDWLNATIQDGRVGVQSPFSTQRDSTDEAND
jgi:hypothetical protein